ncbi:hypothetical protein P175DRAFT_0525050 [Aspergillus ochraceoroseus IBT 24754]|uniref:BRCT domain-containing protein n=1 Tax=Aspergillus ochraceoroseus IBT 24754 TaxID=1392256 RepID=A0A2T5LT70_9EURO|nr:uncharacterized protein P175DRAFT_0525050 [Aspergillus ochraceoroseus IBT 24754]PTU19484.1 hypothetical protein P175DRAFT_0525050 [Aspergillus ochraceoroseus IBT 24754]
MPHQQDIYSVTATNHLRFDPWNSSSTGHQVSDTTTPGTEWRRTREAKLAQQLRTGDCTVDPSSAASSASSSSLYTNTTRGKQKTTQPHGQGEEGQWVWGCTAARTEPDPRQRDIRSMMMRVKKGASSTTVPPSPNQREIQGRKKPVDVGDSGAVGKSRPEHDDDDDDAEEKWKKGSGLESDILHGATVYINGRTAPLVSDHKLRGLLVAHGATLSLALSRRVSHVIIGKPNAGPGGAGAGGGLAAGKIQKEIQRGGWRGIKIVGVEWVLESIKAGKRLPETRFAINLSNQRSVLAFM